MNDARLSRDKAAYMKTPMVVRRSRSMPLASSEEEGEVRERFIICPSLKMLVTYLLFRPMSIAPKKSIMKNLSR